jgi:hypothetical protein
MSTTKTLEKAELYRKPNTKRIITRALLAAGATVLVAGFAVAGENGAQKKDAWMDSMRSAQETNIQKNGIPRAYMEACIMNSIKKNSYKIREMVGDLESGILVTVHVAGNNSKIDAIEYKSASKGDISQFIASVFPSVIGTKVEPHGTFPGGASDSIKLDGGNGYFWTAFIAPLKPAIDESSCNSCPKEIENPNSRMAHIRARFVKRIGENADTIIARIRNAAGIDVELIVSPDGEIASQKLTATDDKGNPIKGDVSKWVPYDAVGESVGSAGGCCTWKFWVDMRDDMSSF